MLFVLKFRRPFDFIQDLLKVVAWTQKSKNQFREIWLETSVKTFFGNPGSHRENLVYFGLAKVKL